MLGEAITHSGLLAGRRERPPKTTTATIIARDYCACVWGWRNARDTTLFSIFSTMQTAYNQVDELQDHNNGILQSGCPQDRVRLNISLRDRYHCALLLSMYKKEPLNREPLSTYIYKAHGSSQQGKLLRDRIVEY